MFPAAPSGELPQHRDVADHGALDCGASAPLQQRLGDDPRLRRARFAGEHGGKAGNGLNLHGLDLATREAGEDHGVLAQEVVVATLFDEPADVLQSRIELLRRRVLSPQPAGPVPDAEASHRRRHRRTDSEHESAPSRHDRRLRTRGEVDGLELHGMEVPRRATSCGGIVRPRADAVKCRTVAADGFTDQAAAAPARLDPYPDRSAAAASANASARTSPRGLDSRRHIHNNTVVDSLTRTLAAVADPTRRSILRRLAGGPAPVRDLVLPFRISQQAISKHLACLERARLIAKRREGRLHICSLNAAPLQEVADWAEEYRRNWEANYRRLDAVLEELKTAQTRRKPDKRQGR